MSTFAELGLSQPIVSSVERLGFVEPTEIQSDIIPLLLKQQVDCIGLAQTGTGKTAAFGLPLVDRVEAKQSHVQGLVLAPTRELCLQITKELITFSGGQPDLQVTSVYGGADIQRQIRALRKGVQIVVATPGRLRDLLRRRAISLDKLRYLVLDEADEMLNMGFREEIDDVLSHCPQERSVWLFSATMSSEIRKITQAYMKDPVVIETDSGPGGHAQIDHQYALVHRNDKLEALKRFMDADPELYGVTFCRTRAESNDVAEELVKAGYMADAIHGELKQPQRDRVMKRFRNREIRMLVATDVAARGIDVEKLTHIFHLNIPDDRAFYTHRSGRTGRAGEKGISMVLASPGQMRFVQDLERSLKLDFERVQVPDAKSILQHQLQQEMESIASTDIHPHADNYLWELEPLFAGMTREEILMRLLSRSLKAFDRQRGENRDLNLSKKKPREQRRSDEKKVRLFINIGAVDVKDKGGFLSFLCDGSGITGSQVGKIDLQRIHTFFDVDEDVVDQVKKSFRHAELNGRQLRINSGVSTGKPKFKKKKKGKKKAKKNK
jgi:ATP-dependent RNA helicase DeaD